MRDLVQGYLSRAISRRGFLDNMTTSGITLVAARMVLSSLDASAQTPSVAATTAEAPVKSFTGTGGACFAEQLVGCGVQYIFGNSASEDAQFYEALVDRPQLKYILSPHEGPGAAMAAGYTKASQQPTIVMQAGAVGLMNAMGQVFNASKEQTPLVFYSYRTDQSKRAGRDGFEEIANQEQVLQPLTKYSWAARGPSMIAETVRHAFKSAWTPPNGPAYMTWHSDYTEERTSTEIIQQSHFDTRMRVRPNPAEVERAAKLLVEARMPVLVVGDEIYKARSVAKAMRLAELLGMPVTQMRQLWSNFPEAHPLWLGSAPAGTLASITWPKNYDLVINVGNKMQHNGITPIVARGIKFIDMRIDYENMGKVMSTDVPLVCDVGLGLDDLIAAVGQLMTPKLAEAAAQRATEVRTMTTRNRSLLAGIVNNPEWNNAPLIADRVTWEVARFADPDAIIVNEAGAVAMHSFNFNPVGGRELFFYYGGHLGSGVGTAAGVKLARPNQQVICLVGDGSFLFGPHALWNMARLELPVITVVYNNHGYCGPHSRAIANAPSGRMVETGQYVASYLGSPDMNMAAIASGFGVNGEVVNNPLELKAALARAKASSVAGKPYLIDVQVARRGIGWTSEKPWIPQIKGSQMRTRKV
ncbi:MAG: thiamine pyrophosphate-binding protein [Pseudomonadota bacterium]|nr:thiamine pyrophosphate-binding protein [Pseudomonadota bacterium]